MNPNWVARYAVLKEKEVVLASFEEWGKFFEEASQTRIIKKTKIAKDIEVSTIFLGINLGDSYRPLWFETMIFGGKNAGFQKRYQTYLEAQCGHEDAVLIAKQDFFIFSCLDEIFRTFKIDWCVNKLTKMINKLATWIHPKGKKYD